MKLIIRMVRESRWVTFAIDSIKSDWNEDLCARLRRADPLSWITASFLWSRILYSWAWSVQEHSHPIPLWHKLSLPMTSYSRQTPKATSDHEYIIGGICNIPGSWSQNCPIVPLSEWCRPCSIAASSCSMSWYQVTSAPVLAWLTRFVESSLAEVPFSDIPQIPIRNPGLIAHLPRRNKRSRAKQISVALYRCTAAIFAKTHQFR